MPDLETTRAALTGSRADEDAAREALFAAQQRTKQLDDEIARIERTTADDRHRPLAEAREKRTRAVALVQENASLVAELRTRAKNIETDFAVVSDPRTAIGALSDSTPFLLFPVRLETRFKAVQSAGVTTQQLW